MNPTTEIIGLLGEVLSLGERTTLLGPDSALLGAIPEFDSMAVVSVVTAIEERFGIAVADDELDAGTFQTVGSLSRFVERKLTG